MAARARSIEIVQLPVAGRYGRVGMGSESRLPVLEVGESAARHAAGRPRRVQRVQYQKRDRLHDELFCEHVPEAVDVDEPFLSATADPARIPDRPLGPRI